MHRQVSREFRLHFIPEGVSQCICHKNQVFSFFSPVSLLVGLFARAIIRVLSLALPVVMWSNGVLARFKFDQDDTDEEEEEEEKVSPTVAAERSCKSLQLLT